MGCSCSKRSRKDIPPHPVEPESNATKPTGPKASQPGHTRGSSAPETRRSSTQGHTRCASAPSSKSQSLVISTHLSAAASSRSSRRASTSPFWTLPAPAPKPLSPAGHSQRSKSPPSGPPSQMGNSRSSQASREHQGFWSASSSHLPEMRTRSSGLSSTGATLGDRTRGSSSSTHSSLRAGNFDNEQDRTRLRVAGLIWDAERELEVCQRGSLPSQAS